MDIGPPPPPAYEALYQKLYKSPGEAVKLQIFIDNTKWTARTRCFPMVASPGKD